MAEGLKHLLPKQDDFYWCPRHPHKRPEIIYTSVTPVHRMKTGRPPELNSQPIYPKYQASSAIKRTCNKNIQRYIGMDIYNIYRHTHTYIHT